MTLEEKLKNLPDKPGVYLMKDTGGHVIYVGKAVSLKNRVRSYFQNTRGHSPKVRVMVEHIADLEYIVTATEIEALILECNLIKKHRPKFNVSLKDDKNFPYIRIPVQEDFPRITVTRAVRKDGARYFGPYTSAGAMHETIRLIKRLFPLRHCQRKIGEDTGRPCLNFHIKRCLAPCDGRVDRETYGNMIREVCLFLEGRRDDVVKHLRRRMEEAAENLEFEKAAQLRDQLAAVEKVTEKQHVVFTGAGDQDVIGMARNDSGTCAQVFFIRDGKLVGREHFMLTGAAAEETEALAAFVKQYYAQAAFIPEEILLPQAVEDSAVIARWLGEKRGGRVTLTVPQRGSKRRLVNMAAENAAIALAEQAERLALNQARTAGAVADLQRYLALERLPERIEAFDISNIQGAEPVASLVVFKEGKPLKDAYRRFKIKSVKGPNDFAMLQEVIHRRYREATPPLPDLILIDGGKGQLHAAREVLRSLGLAHIPTIGLAKEFEHIFMEGRAEPVILPPDSPALHLVQRIRDETHRFAVTYHRNLRWKRNLASVLDEIEGIGPKRRKALWQHFGSLAEIQRATEEELAKVPGMTRQAAAAVYAHFHQS